MSTWEIRNALALLIMPPGGLIVVALLGYLFLRRARRLALGVMAAAWAALYVLSMPYVGDALVRSLEPPFVDPGADLSGDAIVVLGGGRYDGAPEYGGVDTVGTATLGRLRYGALLYRRLGKPVLVTAGAPRGEATSEAVAMKRVLEDEFDVPVRWSEAAASTTEENAALSRRLLSAAGVDRIYLVTHAWHMKRAQSTFERAGFTVIPAPTMYRTPAPRRIVDFLPDADALENSKTFVHETVGLWWYDLRSWINSRRS